MLVLSRKAEETIVFPELGITVEVIRTKGNTVRLGIRAPESVRILRGELQAIVSEFEEPLANSHVGATMPMTVDTQVA